MAVSEWNRRRRWETRAMIAPPNSGSVFFNYKGMHSIVLMGIANANYELIYIDVGRNGRISDGGVYNSCSFGQAMDCDALNLPPPKPARPIHACSIRCSGR